MDYRYFSQDEQQQDIECPPPAIEPPPHRREIGWPLRPGPRDIESTSRPCRPAPKGRPSPIADEHPLRDDRPGAPPGRNPQSGGGMGDVHEDVELQPLTQIGIARSN